MSDTFFIQTFGCQMNEYDSGRMADALVAEGMAPAATAEAADLILLNTCSVREKAQEKVFHQLGRYKGLKRSNPRLLIGVAGCVASQEGEAILSRAPYVDLVVGPQTLHRIPALIRSRRSTGRPQVDVSFPEIEKFDHLPVSSQEGATAFVSIMEGCSKYCTYCIVPFTRGQEVSRPFEDVLAEAAGLVQGGVRELNLLGQNVNAYQGPTAEGGVADLAMLLDYLAELPGLGRLRFTTSHPVNFSPALVEAVGRVSKLASYIHLPVQSGSDRILAAMRRGYTVLEYKNLIRRIREARPGVSVGADFIVGFPGETEEDFAATLRLVEEIGFDTSFSFMYSVRPGTPAAQWEDDVPKEVKDERLARLQAALNQGVQAIGAAMVGTRQRVLVEGTSKKSDFQLSGRTDNNRVVNFEGNPRLIGEFVEVDIHESLPHSLRGEVVIK